MKCIVIILMLVGVSVSLAHAEEKTLDWRDIDYSAINGANYIPTYAYNDVVLWDKFDPEVIDRELGYAEKAGVNSVRVWLQIIVYEKDPERFLNNFETFLQLCDKHNITMMPILFNSCFGEEPNFESYNWVQCPGNKRVSQDTWPGCEKYVKDIVTRHIGDPRIIMWDVMNEPMVAGAFNQKKENQDKIWRFLRHFIRFVNELDPTHATSAGVCAIKCFDEVGEDCRVLNFHSYFGGEPNHRKDIADAKAWSAAHGDKPIIISEMAHTGLDQDLKMTIDVCREEGIGFYIFELMIGITPFAPWQGVFYPDGTIRSTRDFCALLGVEVKHPLDGVPQVWGFAEEDLQPRFACALAAPTADWNLDQRLILLYSGALAKAIAEKRAEKEGMSGDELKKATDANLRAAAEEIRLANHEIRRLHSEGNKEGCYEAIDALLLKLGQDLGYAK